MPRRNAKSRAKSGNNVKSCDASKNTTRKQKNYVKKEKCNKELVVDPKKETVIEEVFHRKSERRRVARDIFLVFEEESNCKGKTRANKKQPKPKFGHLKIDNPIRPKGLLRDIKNEQKVYQNCSGVHVNSSPGNVPILKSKSNVLSVSKEEKIVKSEKIKTSICETVKSVYSNKTKNIKSIKISTLESQPCKLGKEQKLVAKVNPIFLWVKQDDTRIVEVRCEDYDKRNRIRITKTTNGWRAIPRSDPTTSRVLKFYPTSLMKVKRENNGHESNIIDSNSEIKKNVFSKNFSTTNILPESNDKTVDAKLKGIDTVRNPMAIKNVITKNKKPKKQKRKHSEKIFKKSKTSATAEQGTAVNTLILTKQLNLSHSSDVRDFPVQINVGLESEVSKKLAPENDLFTNDINKSISVNTFKKNSEHLETKIRSINSSFSIDTPSDKKFTYQKEVENKVPFLLCPKTGLFLPIHAFSEYENESNENLNDQNASKDDKNCFLTSNKNEFIIDISKLNEDPKIQIPEENIESLEAKTKNLKDLLDDADLFQNCDDNTNSDADLIDTIVKTSCENNLIQANEIITKATIEQLHQKTLHESNEVVVQLISDVSDPPKCLSFNEAGEIEGLNGELFQSSNYMETFDKQASRMSTEPHVILHSTTSVAETSSPPQKTSSCENMEPIEQMIDNNIKFRSVSEIEDAPKDLSYKKREEVCPPSESRSQCAVTSSSDVIKSPQQEETSSLSTSSETLKTLILEQFIKLNALTSQHQMEPIDTQNQRHSDLSNIKTIYTSKSAHSNSYIETVIIEDDDENDGDIDNDEPLKKRLKINNHKVVTQSIGKLSMIDKDPDPLTQLRLLIRNTQWKVPDPILVPKERLSAVLASPAREIPLLITTRPELRLPEAFAYPEIIQNPNILVISMAQLEAILKNELEIEKAVPFKVMKPDMNEKLSGAQRDIQLTNRVSSFQSQSPKHQQSSNQPKNILTNTSQINNMTPDLTDISDSLSKTRQEYAKIPQTDLSLTSDLNSAAIAVLNQMLWLPYFGQIFQDIGNTTKNPTAFNSQQNGITNLEAIFKNNNNKMIGQSLPNTALQSFQQQFKTNEELSLFQKIVQNQMQSVLQLNKLKPDTSQNTGQPAAGNIISSIEKSKSKIEPLSKLMEERKQKVIYSNQKLANTSVCKNHTSICGDNILVPEKTYNLRSSVVGRHTLDAKQYSNNNQRQIADTKPRLTCKSLSNLLDPEHSMVPSSSSKISYVQNDFAKSVTEIKRNSSECKINNNNADGKEQFVNSSTMAPLSCGNINVSIESDSGIAKQKANIFENNSANNDAAGLTADTNIPLWHPLFGSNTKTAYSSPWQWTTVTASGE